MTISDISPIIVSLALSTLLAIYGWRLITRLARRREAYDLYCSILSLLEQLDADGQRAWESCTDFLDEYTELKLLSKIADVEQRLRLIDKHYSPGIPSKITSTDILELRRLLTTTSDLVPPEELRSVAIHRLTTTMISILLEENYQYITKNPWCPF